MSGPASLEDYSGDWCYECIHNCYDLALWSHITKKKQKMEPGQNFTLLSKWGSALIAKMSLNSIQVPKKVTSGGC